MVYKQTGLMHMMALSDKAWETTPLFLADSIYYTRGIFLVGGGTSTSTHSWMTMSSENGVAAVHAQVVLSLSKRSVWHWAYVQCVSIGIPSKLWTVRTLATALNRSHCSIIDSRVSRGEKPPRSSSNGILCGNSKLAHMHLLSQQTPF